MARNPQPTSSVATNDNRTPTFIVRAPDPNRRGRWITLGAAWPLRDGQPGYSVKLNTLPVGNRWDGALVLLPPLAQDDQGKQE